MGVKTIFWVTAILMLLTYGTGVAKKSGQGIFEGTININTATVEEFSRLPTIGRTEATRIINYRSTNGPSKATNDLLKVEGIRRVEYDLIEKFLTVEGETTLER